MSAYRKNVSEGVFAYTDEADKMFMEYLATDSTVAQCEPYSLRCSYTSRTARSRNSGENLVLVVFVVFIVAPVSQIKEPPQNPGRFTALGISYPSGRIVC
jgi:hypothetical protein